MYGLKKRYQPILNDYYKDKSSKILDLVKACNDINRELELKLILKQVELGKLGDSVAETRSRRKGRAGPNVTQMDKYGHDAYCWAARNYSKVEAEVNFLRRMIRASSRFDLKKVLDLETELDEVIMYMRLEDHNKLHLLD